MPWPIGSTSLQFLWIYRNSITIQVCGNFSLSSPLTKFNSVVILNCICTEVIDKYYVPLNATSVLKAVLSMVAENCPNILGINLSQNMLYSIEGLRSTVTKMPHLKVLHLDHNMVSTPQRFTIVFYTGLFT